MARVSAIARCAAPRLALLLALALTNSASVRADELPLHERIDQAIETAAGVSLAPSSSDADFLRRASLDLNGTIPSAAAARSFLDDAAPDKRTSLIDRLLAAPQFARHMARVWDVMLMERRPEKVIPVAEWQQFLHESFAQGKPLDQMLREILSADGSDSKQRGPARFYLDRDADANLITRDVGRLLFGRDMQCAQCHDHPLIADYLQQDYYGLMAFFNRGTLFADTKEKKSYYAESAEGEVNYKSVFTGDARDHVIPKLPAGSPVDEPLLAPEEQYVLAPTKTTRGIPKYSRRAQLAALVTSGANPQFSRNLANRLWAQLMGRGLIHPLDFDHSANPPVESKLLGTLADELVKLKFDAKKFLRELALTRVYQRSSEPKSPESLQVDSPALLAVASALEAEAQQLEPQLGGLEKAADDASGELNAAYEAFSKAAAARDAADKVRAEAKKASDELSKTLAAAIEEAKVKEELERVLNEARDKAQAAAAKLPGDKPIVEAAAQFATRSAETTAQLAAARKTIAEKTPQVQAVSLKMAEADKALQPALGALAAARAAVMTADAKTRAALDAHRAAKARKRELAARAADARSAAGCQTLLAARAASGTQLNTATQQLASLKTQGSATGEAVSQAEGALKSAEAKAAEDQKALDQAIENLLDRGTSRFAVAPLKPLSPDQMAFATMQAVGLLETERKAFEPAVRKEVEAMTTLAAEARPAEIERLLEARADEKVRGNIAPFASLFGQQPGQAATFQATVHQALFLSNGGLLASWLNPSGENLTDRLAKMAEPAQVADELYLSVLTRRAQPDEVAAVAAFWQASQANRPAAARDLVWSLLTSTEFRFNH
jgi:hypothetical protein